MYSNTSDVASPPIDIRTEVRDDDLVLIYQTLEAVRDAYLKRETRRICLKERSAVVRSNTDYLVQHLGTVDEIYSSIVASLTEDTGIEAVIVNEDYLLLYSVVKPYYSKDNILQEQLVLRIRNTGATFINVVDTLRLLCKVNSCRGILVGTALAFRQRALARLYENAGFIDVSITQLYWE